MNQRAAALGQWAEEGIGVLLIATLMRLFEDDSAMCERLEPMARRAIRNRNGDEVGEVRPAGDLG